jgi:lipid-binding SYLF domain-containing protein
MRGFAIAASLLIVTGAGAWADTPQEHLQSATRVFSEIMQTPDKGIPQDLLDRAECVIILPGVKKAAFIVGGEYGHGIAECRKSSGTGWGAPAMMKLEGGSLGWQIGGESADIVMLVMNRHGMNKLLGDKVTLGADASIAAGPVGRQANAQTDLKLTSEILAWSRVKGVFAGLALNGASLRPDKSEDHDLYGRGITTKEIVLGNVQPPPAAHPLIAELNRYSGASSADRAK